jgi:glycerophosphoryl diester phosphodiesterase
MQHFPIIAHRGWGITSITHQGRALPQNKLAENTLPAFKAALEQGADGIECDVFLSQDGHLMVIHDAALDRHVNPLHTGWDNHEPSTLGYVHEFTQAALQQQFVVGPNGEKIPTLDEVLHLVAAFNKTHQRQVIPNIELKGSQQEAEALYHYLASIPEDLGIDVIEVVSFNLDSLKTFCHLQQTKPLKQSLTVGFAVKTELLFADDVDWGPCGTPLRAPQPTHKEHGKTPRPEVVETIDRAKVKKLCNELKQHGITSLDVASVDLTPELFQICDQMAMSLWICVNVLKARTWMQLKYPQDPKFREASDLDIQIIDQARVMSLCQQHAQIAVKYKADMPDQAIKQRDTWLAKVNDPY